MRFLILLASLNLITWGGVTAVFGELSYRAAERTAAPVQMGFLILALPAVLAMAMVVGCWLVRKREPTFSLLWAITVFVLVCSLLAFIPIMAVSGGGV